MSPGTLRKGLGGYLVVESVLHDGLTVVLGVVAMTHGATWLGLLAVTWAVVEVSAKVTAAVLLNRKPLRTGTHKRVRQTFSNEFLHPL